MKKLSVVVALFAALVSSAFASSPANAKTFVGVLWPMFGPLPAIGLVELTAEIRTMPDVEVHTYLHQEWPDLVKDISHLPEGTRTIVIGYSLGANATPSVANNSKYIDTIIALQPSLFSWNPPFTGTGKVGHIIEVYNPNSWMTFGGMGSKKLAGADIEYIANNDSHPGAQFNPEFRELVKSEIRKLTDEPAIETAQAAPAKLARLQPPLAYASADADLKDSDQKESVEKELVQKAAAQSEFGAKKPPAKDNAQTSHDKAPETSHEPIHARLGQAELPLPSQRPQPPQLQQPPQSQQPVRLATAAVEFTKHQPRAWTAFLDGLSSSVNSGDLTVKHELTLADLMNYARRTYVAHRSGNSDARQASLVGGDMIVASNIDPHRTGPSGACCAFVKAEGDVD